MGSMMVTHVEDDICWWQVPDGYEIHLRSSDKIIKILSERENHVTNKKKRHEIDANIIITVLKLGERQESGLNHEVHVTLTCAFVDPSVK